MYLLDSFWGSLSKSTLCYHDLLVFPRGRGPVAVARMAKEAHRRGSGARTGLCPEIGGEIGPRNLFLGDVLDIMIFMDNRYQGFSEKVF